MAIFLSSGVSTPVAAPAAITLKVKNNTAIRSKPTNNSTLIKAVIKGETLTLTGKAEKGWFPVQSGNAKGYVNVLHVEINNPPPTEESK